MLLEFEKLDGRRVLVKLDYVTAIFEKGEKELLLLVDGYYIPVKCSYDDLVKEEKYAS